MKEKNNAVYSCFDSDNKNVYIGMTKQDLNIRLKQHQRAGKEFETIKTVHTGLTRNQSRAVETSMINENKRKNIILSISKKISFMKKQCDRLKIIEEHTRNQS